VITDFVDFTAGKPDRDQIDLTAIDANSGVLGDQAFVSIATGAFVAGSSAGRMRYQQINGTTVLPMEVNTDGVADMSIVLCAVGRTYDHLVGLRAVIRWGRWANPRKRGTATSYKGCQWVKMWLTKNVNHLIVNNFPKCPHVDAWDQSRKSSLMPVLERVCASTFFTMTAQYRFTPPLAGSDPATTTE